MFLDDFPVAYIPPAVSNRMIRRRVKTRRHIWTLSPIVVLPEIGNKKLFSFPFAETIEAIYY